MLQALLERLIARLDARLNAVVNLTRVSAGATLETWSFDAVGTDQRLPLILRRAPGARAQGTLPLPIEARVLQAVRACGVPAPKVWHILTPQDELGEGFLMERIDGLTIPQKILRSPELAGIRPRLAHQFGEILASIHRVPVSRVPELRVLDAEHQLRQLRQQYQQQPTRRPVFDLALRWLQERVPGPAPRTLVHGDYRHGNIIVGPQGARAVLDWEGAHVGDPAQDLAWLCLPPWRFGELDKPAGGLGTREDFWQGYQAAAGCAIDAQRVAWWEVLGSLRWGVVCADMPHWVESGRDRTVERAMIARRASENELDLLRLLAPRH